MTKRTFAITMVALPLVFAAVNVVLFFVSMGGHGMIWAAIMCQASSQMATVFKSDIWPDGDY